MKLNNSHIQSSLQHECQTGTTQVRYEGNECDTSATRATRVRHEGHECNTSATRVLTNDISAKRVLHEQSECDTSENF